MGVFGSTLASPSGLAEGVSLNEEELEEMKMVSSYTDSELQKLYRYYCKYKNPDAPSLSQESFLAIPDIEMNPLKERLVHLFDLDDDCLITFAEFVSVSCALSPKGSREKKLKFAFKMYDVDGDGEISAADLRHILELTTKFEEFDEERRNEALSLVVERTIQEATGKEAAASISFDDFQKVIARTDFKGKLNLNLRI